MNSFSFLIKSKNHYIKNIFGLDRAILYTLITKIIQIFGGLFSILVIVKFLKIEEQGFYYTFSSLAALQVFFELGLNSIIIQFVAHEKSFLSWKKIYMLEGNDTRLSRLSSLLRLIIKWYLYFSFFLFLILLIIGFYFFTHFNNTNELVNWNIPWILLSFSTSISLMITPFLSFLEGLGKIKEVAKIRLFQQLFSLLILWIGLFSGLKLYVLGLTGLASSCFSFFLIVKNKKIFTFIWRKFKSEKVSYINEIFPYQWRIAISWISGYFIFQSFTPILFATDGALSAGQMGITLVALSGILSLSFSWVTTKVPIFSGFVAQENFLQLDHVFNKTLFISSVINFLTLLFFFFSIYFMRIYNFRIGNFSISDRFLDNYSLFFMSIPVFINHIVGSWAVYLRSHKKEPYLLYSFCQAISITLSVIYFGKKYGLTGITRSYFLISVIYFPVAYYIFKFYKNKWHRI
jgi:O-antigen/teichoic acid export membrane protein